MPICMVVYNKDANESDYENLKDIFRPGHADFTFYNKFKIYDYRGGGRASGRETIARVAASGLVEYTLKDIKIESSTIKIGKFEAQNNEYFENELYWPDRNSYAKLINYLEEIKREGNSIGGIVEVRIKNVPTGLGDPVFEKLDANLSKAIISIGAIKGIEFGSGFLLANLKGSESNDPLDVNGFQTNNSGGILGGISTGQDIVLRYIVKPTSSISLKQHTIDHSGKPKEISINGRHDICIIPRIIPVAEAMIKLVLADALAFQKLIDSHENNLTELREAIDKIDEDLLLNILRRLTVAKKIISRKKKLNLPEEDINREKEIIEIIKSHNFENLNIIPNKKESYGLIASDALSGLIISTALVMPSKKLSEVEVKSVKKKFKQKDFARNVSREKIMFCERLGIDKDKFFEIGIKGLQSVSKELGL